MNDSGHFYHGYLTAVQRQLRDLIGDQTHVFSHSRMIALSSDSQPSYGEHIQIVWPEVS